MPIHWTAQINRSGRKEGRKEGRKWSGGDVEGSRYFEEGDRVTRIIHAFLYPKYHS